MVHVVDAPDVPAVVVVACELSSSLILFCRAALSWLCFFLSSMSNLYNWSAVPRTLVLLS